MTSLSVIVNFVIGRTTIFWAAAYPLPLTDHVWQPWTWWRIRIDVVGDAEAVAARATAVAAPIVRRAMKRRIVQSFLEMGRAAGAARRRSFFLGGGTLGRWSLCAGP